MGACGVCGRAVANAFQITRQHAWQSRAAGEVDRAMALDPQAPEVILAVADVHAASGREEDALEGYRRALSLRPDLFEARLGLAPDEFRAACTRPLRGGEISLRERRDGSCVFYSKGGCSVYAVRPRQCRTWPFWRAVLHSPERWADEAADCPGMGRGALHARDAIERLVADDGTSGRLPRSRDPLGSRS